MKGGQRMFEVAYNRYFNKNKVTTDQKVMKLLIGKLQKTCMVL